jgi:LacI family transcriptional regulator
MAAIAASAESALREAGLVMVLCDTHDRPELQDEYLREMLAQQACAIVLLGAVDSPKLRDLQSGETTLIFVNRRNPIPAIGSFVGIDNIRAGEDAARWALAQDMFSAALIHAPLLSSATRDRVAGVRGAFAAAGHHLPPGMVLSPDRPDHLLIGRDAAAELIASGMHPEVLICTSDLIAFGAARAWREALPNRPPPRMIGFDDSPLNEWLAPHLSSIRIPYEAFGRAIVAAISAPETSRETILPHGVIERPAALR